MRHRRQIYHAGRSFIHARDLASELRIVIGAFLVFLGSRLRTSSLKESAPAKAIDPWIVDFTKWRVLQ